MAAHGGHDDSLAPVRMDESNHYLYQIAKPADAAAAHPDGDGSTPEISMYAQLTEFAGQYGGNIRQRGGGKMLTDACHTWQWDIRKGKIAGGSKGFHGSYSVVERRIHGFQANWYTNSILHVSKKQLILGHD
jgi:hypothetical protein